jgi:hypothetical protein
VGYVIIESAQWNGLQWCRCLQQFHVQQIRKWGRLSAVVMDGMTGNSPGMTNISCGGLRFRPPGRALPPSVMGWPLFSREVVCGVEAVVLRTTPNEGPTVLPLPGDPLRSDVSFMVDGLRKADLPQ